MAVRCRSALCSGSARELSEREVFSYAIRRFGSLEVQMTELKYLYGVLLSQQGERSGEGVSPGNYYKNPSSEIIYYAVEYICMYFKGPICKIW